MAQNMGVQPTNTRRSVQIIKRALLSGLCVLAALILGTPALVGLYLARHFDQYAMRLNQTGLIKVIDTRFERGWFKSHAQITVQLADRFCADPPCATLTLNSTIHQGPLAFTAPRTNSDTYRPAWAVVVSHVPLAPLWPRLVFDPSINPLKIVTHVGLRGQVSSTASLPSTRVDVQRQTTVAHAAMARLVANIWTTLDNGPLKATVSWPLLRIRGAEHGQLVLHGLRAELRTASHSRHRIVEQHLRINSLTLGNGRGLAGRLERIAWKAEPVPGDNDGMATRFDGRIHQIIINTGKYGPLRVHGRIEGVNLAIWRALKNQLITTEGSRKPATSTLRTLYKLYLPPILEAGPVFDISHFSMGTPQGRIQGHIRLSIPDDLKPPDALAKLLDQISLVFQGRVPTPLLRRVIRWIATSHGLLDHPVTVADVNSALKSLAQDQLIKPLADGRAYHVEFAINHGEIQLNGKNQKDWSTLLNTLQKTDADFNHDETRDKMAGSRQ